MKNELAYSQKRGREFFDWNEFLNQKTITEDEWDEADYLADSWVTCACGNLCADIPRGEYGQPKDYLLTDLGLFFQDAIADKNTDKAKVILLQIEKRSTELIKNL